MSSADFSFVNQITKVWHWIEIVSILYYSKLWKYQFLEESLQPVLKYKPNLLLQFVLWVLFLFCLLFKSNTSNDLPASKMQCQHKRPCQRFNASYHAFVVVIVVLHTCDLIANKESSIFNGMKTWNKVMKKSSTSKSKACTRGALPKCLFTWRCLDEPVIILSDYRICLQLVAYIFKMKKVRWAVNHWHWHQ